MWDKRDWEQFYDLAQGGWQRLPPPSTAVTWTETRLTAFASARRA
jgi:hypothetical protein